MADSALDHDYDPEADILTIEGCRYSGRLFRELGEEGMKTDTLFRLLRREDGVITIEEVSENAA